MTSEEETARLRAMADQIHELREERDALQASLDEKDRAEQYRAHGDGLSWRLPFSLADEVATKHLPVPRLEVRWRGLKMGRYERCALQGLVIRSYAERDEPTFLPLGRTSQGGSAPRDRLETPWRMGVEVLADMLDLGLRGFVVSEPGDGGHDGFAVREIAFPAPEDMAIGLRQRWTEKRP